MNWNRGRAHVDQAINEIENQIKEDDHGKNSSRREDQHRGAGNKKLRRDEELENAQAGTGIHGAKIEPWPQERPQEPNQKLRQSERKTKNRRWGKSKRERQNPWRWRTQPENQWMIPQKHHYPTEIQRNDFSSEVQTGLQ
jgi:hypothetical protein